LIDASEENEITLAAVDVGGTFTDLMGVSRAGLTAIKVPSTPRDPELAVLDALSRAGASAARLVHGSTVATNAILERKGARTAFIATSGFADLLEIGRQERPHLYRLLVRKPEPLVGRRLRFEASERLGPRGEVVKELTRPEARRVAAAVAASGARSAAVCLLFSFEQPDHEELIGEELEKLGVSVSLSSWVLPEYREYERASTTVINAYVSPVMEGYLDRLESALGGEAGGRLRLMHSAGGTVSSGLARRRAADLVLSGPAGGAVAAGWLASSLGIDNVISFDMGGTSTDVSLISGGLTVTRETRISGLPVALPMVDIHTIGAGGGSIASVDRAGVLKVGPESAGADPGPACYGKGSLPTVTDANLALGRLESSWFLGGRMPLFADRSHKALAGLGGKSVESAAGSMLEVALSHMEAAVKKVSLERGYDPREFALVAFGGAGPMHACELATRLEIPRVLVPRYPGLFSSMGMLLARPGRDYTHSLLRVLDKECVRVMAALFEELESAAAHEMSRDGFTSGLRFTRSLEMRYRGQSHEVSVPVVNLAFAQLERHFEAAYRAAFGYLRQAHDVEVVNVRLACRAPRTELPLTPEVGGSKRAPRPLSTREIFFEEPVKGAVFSRWELSPSHPVTGPALIVQEDTTTVVPPGWRAAVDVMGNLDMEVSL
jgi:N-methylhydantoinase A